jgi:hypothetical protein
MLSASPLREVCMFWVKCCSGFMQHFLLAFFPAMMAHRMLPCPATHLPFPPTHVQHFDRSWVAHTTAKGLLYEVEAGVRGGAALVLEDDVAGVAKQIARLKVRGVGGVVRKQIYAASGKFSSRDTCSSYFSSTNIQWP